MKFVVFEQALSPAIVILQKKKLVVFSQNTIRQVDHSIEAEILTRSYGDAAAETAVVAHELKTGLKKTAISYYVFIVHDVDYRRQQFGMYHKIVCHHHVSGKGHSVPRTRIYGIAPVALMFDNKCELAYISVFYKKYFIFIKLISILLHFFVFRIIMKKYID